MVASSSSRMSLPTAPARRSFAPPGARPGCTQAGFTLIEIVVAVVVLAIAVCGTMAGLSAISVQSADAMVTEQATAVASAYLNEVLQKPFGAFDGKTTRATLDVVDDYNGALRRLCRMPVTTIAPRVSVGAAGATVFPAAVLG